MGPSVVLLTGETGLLGHHLLEQLLACASTRKVICIAVRNPAKYLESQTIPPASDRVVYCKGDLSQPRFGLSETEATAIFDQVHAIIHNVADTSHLSYYRNLEAANVESTRQLLRYAVPRGITIHYISSAGVALFSNMNTFPEVSILPVGSLDGTERTDGLSLIFPAPDGRQGYLASNGSMKGSWSKQARGTKLTFGSTGRQQSFARASTRRTRPLKPIGSTL